MARQAWAAQVADTEPGLPDLYLGLSLAYLGRTAEAIREAERCLGSSSSAKQRDAGDPYVRHQVVRIHILAGVTTRRWTCWSRC